MLVGVISFGSNICYTGPCSSSLALVCAFYGWFRCFRSLEGVSPIALSLFLWICMLLNLRMPCFRLTYCLLVFGGPVHLASRSGVGV